MLKVVMTEHDGVRDTSENDSDSPDQVFHYTSLDTMMKIVDSRSIWSTALPYLNDSGERQFLLDAVAPRLSLLKQLDSSIDPLLGIRAWEAEDAVNLTSFADEAFVTCFAKQRDSLMHWRAYCPQQCGVAIGFSSACLREARLAERPQPGMVVTPPSFGRVGYVDTKNTELLDRIIYKAYEIAKEEFARPSSWATLNDYFRWTLEDIACMNKQEAFQVEDEFRLLLRSVRYRENNIKFRTVRSTLIPYVAMAIPNYTNTGPVGEHNLNSMWNAVRSVVVGPTANMPLTIRSVKAYFQQRGMVVEVIESNIPYRDW